MKNSLIKKVLIIFLILILVPLISTSFFSSFVKSNLIFIIFIILIFTLAFAFLFSKLVIDPINKLHRGIEIITKGNLDYRVDIKTNDEIAELGEALNQMAEELKEYHIASEESKTILKIKVRARTKELEELAKTLEGKVKKRTKELEKRLNELEKFHKLTVGRELKMIDLKEELAKLKSEKREG